VTVPVNGEGDAATTMSWQTAGTRHITASFCPADTALISSDGISDVTVTDEKTATTVALQSIPAAVVAWEPLTLRANVTPAEAGLPGLTGAVQFSNERGPIGEPVKLDGTNTASIPFAAGAGDSKLRARYSGDGLYAASEAMSAQSVRQARSVTSIGSSANPAQAGKAIRWAIDAAAQAPSQGTPAGHVRLSIDGKKPTEYTLKQLRQGPLTVTDLAAGRHAVVVEYTGDADYRASTATLTQTVTAPADSPAPPTTGGPTVTPASPAPGQPAAPAPAAGLPAPRAPATPGAPATPATPGAPGGAPATPVVRPLDEAALVRALHVPRTLMARAGTVVVGTAANPPVRSLSAALFADRGTRAARAKKATAFGRVRVAIAAGGPRAIRVVLNRAGRRALRAHGRVRVELRIAAVDSSARTVRTTLARRLTRAHH
jgi:hypothetical protein